MSQGRIVEAATPGAIEEAAEIIRNGGLVAFPTETVYGLGADACNPLAVARIFEVKRRPRIDPLIVHVARPESALRYAELLDPRAQLLMKRFWPGPLTLVSRKTDAVPPIVTAGLDTVAVRMPAHPAALALIEASATAIAAPSANPFGYVSPTEARHVQENLGEQIDLILDGGRCPVGVESTVLSLAGSRPCILRAGGVIPAEIEDLIGAVDWETRREQSPQAPGQMERHYATHTPLEILPEENDRAVPAPAERVGLLTLEPPDCPGCYTAVEVLSERRNLREAAANLFAALRRLDGLGLDRIVAHPVPEEGLGLAIMDRLRRCAAGSAGDHPGASADRSRGEKHDR